MTTASHKFRNSELASSPDQLKILNGQSRDTYNSFLKKSGLEKLTAGKSEIFQINPGMMCNQTCRHYFVCTGGAGSSCGGEIS